MRFTTWLFTCFCLCLSCNFNYLDTHPDAATEPGDETAALAVPPRIDVLIIPFDVLAQFADAGLDEAADVITEKDAANEAEATEPEYICLSTGCIHETEVTKTQYATWLATNPTPTSFWDCSSNVSFVPTCNWPQSDDTPVVCVDWCDARAFCASHGASLCSSSTWTSVCSNGGTTTGPLGTAVASALACNTPLHTTKKAIAAVKSLPDCKTTKGIFDLIGNAGEWTATNDGVQGSVRGGDYLSSTGACADYTQQDLTAGNPSTGFRCCK